MVNLSIRQHFIYGNFSFPHLVTVEAKPYSTGKPRATTSTSPAGSDLERLKRGLDPSKAAISLCRITLKQGAIETSILLNPAKKRNLGNLPLRIEFFLMPEAPGCFRVFSKNKNKVNVTIYQIEEGVQKNINVADGKKVAVRSMRLDDFLLAELQPGFYKITVSDKDITHQVDLTLPVISPRSSTAQTTHSIYKEFSQGPAYSLAQILYERWFNAQSPRREDDTVDKYGQYYRRNFDSIPSTWIVKSRLLQKAKGIVELGKRRDEKGKKMTLTQKDLINYLFEEMNTRAPLDSVKATLEEEAAFILKFLKKRSLS